MIQARAARRLFVYQDLVVEEDFEGGVVGVLGIRDADVRGEGVVAARAEGQWLRDAVEHAAGRGLADTVVTYMYILAGV